MVGRVQALLVRVLFLYDGDGIAAFDLGGRGQGSGGVGMGFRSDGRYWLAGQ